MIHLVIPLWIGIYFCVGLLAGSIFTGWALADTHANGSADYLAAGGIGMVVVVGWPFVAASLVWIDLRKRRGRKLRAVRAKFGFENEG